MIEGRPELKVFGTDDQHPDQWTVFIGCASERVRADFRDWLANVL